jgi:hypothetical protein
MRRFIAPGIFAISLLMCSLSCNSVDPQKEIQDILKINNDHRQAHLHGNAQLFTKQMSDTIATIQDGKVFINSKEATYDRFEAYFQTVSYRRWDDVGQPRIDLSEDGKMATLITQKIIDIASNRESEELEFTTSQWAWMSAFKKEDGEWLLYAISSGRVRDER